MADVNIPLLDINNLHKSFVDKPILNDVNLTINEGEVVVIIGPSGCGKSTLLRCINGLEKISSGSILFDCNNLHEAKTKWADIRQQIGMVFQNYELFPNLTVQENILLAPMKVQKRKKEEVLIEAENLLLRVGLADKLSAYPRELSGGQKQRIAIIRALIMHPKMMLFDEVTASLDPEMIHEVLDVISELANQGMTMLIVTHEMNFARKIANRIIFMDKGSIIEEGNPIAFFEHPETLRAKQFLAVLNY